MTLILQVSDATKAVKEIGFPAAIAVILLAAVIAALPLLFQRFFKYFTGRLDKKDEMLEKRNEQLTEVIQERHEDVVRIEKFMDESTRGQKRIADVLETLANDMRRGGR